jgi:hypothetical protein
MLRENLKEKPKTELKYLTDYCQTMYQDETKKQAERRALVLIENKKAAGNIVTA